MCLLNICVDWIHILVNQISELTFYAQKNELALNPPHQDLQIKKGKFYQFPQSINR